MQTANININKMIRVPNTDILARLSVKNNNIHVWTTGCIDTQIEAASYVADYYYTSVVAEFNGSFMTVQQGLSNDSIAKEQATKKFQSIYNNR